ncbi:MAG: NUDIX hydrolase [Balneola sp.]|nr:MAG: NUDIX hydrolase [Balneola sp.]
MSSEVYSNKLRIRACGVLIDQDRILLVQLYSPVSVKNIWTTPGGGVDFGESLKAAVKREFFEETGLKVNVKKLLLINELIDGLYHALEFFFEVAKEEGQLKLGQDPEHPDEEQLLKDLRFFTRDELESNEDIKPEILRKVFNAKEGGQVIRVSFKERNG